MARRKAERTRRAFGKVSVKGKRVYAEYTGPDGAFHRPGHSFPSKIDAEGWLAEESLAEGGTKPRALNLQVKEFKATNSCELKDCFAGLVYAALG